MNQRGYADYEHKENIADKIFEKHLKEDYPFEMQRTLRLIKQHDLIGVLMAKAVEQGEFDNLEGAGKPLDLDENPFSPAELHMVHKILKDHGYAPYWIEINKEINDLQANLAKEVADFKKYTLIVISEKRSSLAMRRYEQKKDNFYRQCRQQFQKISRKILDYNLHCPVSLGRSNFDVDVEMNRIVDDLEELIILGLGPNKD